LCAVAAAVSGSSLWVTAAEDSLPYNMKIAHQQVPSWSTDDLNFFFDFLKSVYHIEMISAGAPKVPAGLALHARRGRSPDKSFLNCP
jgi:hypothetical protein